VSCVASGGAGHAVAVAHQAGLQRSRTGDAPPTKAVSLTSSGISQIDDTQPLVGTFIDEEFSLAFGLRSTLRDVVNQFNFGVVQVQPTGSGAEISAVLAHEGNGFAFGLDVKDLI
jgi:hypothetical protein